MADDELATKAPEIDAQQQNTFTGDLRAQQDTGMGDHCVTDRPARQVPTGEITKLGDVDVYIAKPSDYPHSPSKLLLLLTGGTGIKSTNNQLQADKYAAEGFLVVMPDQFSGDPAPNAAETIAAIEPSPTFIDQVKLRVAEAAKSFQIDMWLARHTPETVLPILRRVCEAAKDEFADAIANGGGIYAVGYCFGAKYVLILGGEFPDQLSSNAEGADEEQGTITRVPLIKVGAIAHGTLVTREDLNAIKVPVYMACVEHDQLFPEEILDAGRKVLAQNHIEHEIKVFSNVPHGFAVIGDYADAKIQDAQKQAYGEMLGWLQSH